MTNAVLVHICLVSTGAALGTGLLSLAAHIGNRERDYYLPSALTCGFGSIVFLGLAAIYDAQTLEAARLGLHLHVVGVLLAVGASVWLFARFARIALGRGESLVLGVATLALLLLDAISPASLRFAALSPQPPGVNALPFQGHAGWTTVVLHAWLLVPGWMTLRRGLGVWRRGQRGFGGAMIAATLAFVAANAIGARSDFMAGRPPYIGGPAVVGVTVMLLGLAAGLAQRRRRLALIASGDELRVANEQLRVEMRERVRLEARLAETQRMEALGRMAAGVAHDFNNLLHVMLGHAEMIRMEHAAGSSEGAHAAAIEEAAKHGAALTQQLLAFARRQELVVTRFDADRTIGGERELLEALVRPAVRIELRLHAPGRTILGDPAQFNRVLVNLASNARDAMRAGGVLTIETAWCEDGGGCPCAGAIAGGHLQLRVSDTGMGIAPEVLPHVFEPFFTTKPPGEGTGLGLATVHGIVTQSGGHIAVTSTPGAGATFRICWPGGAGVAADAARAVGASARA